jgi:death-on-curing protein
MTDWIWVRADAARTLHDGGIAEHGGISGVRDAGAFESALARPVNAAAYGKPDAADLAAAYAFGLARNHPFADGNKRTAWSVARLFLELNGRTLRYTDDDAISFMLALAAGDLAEAEAADWFRARLG